MKANINITQGESTRQHIERKVAKYLAKNERPVSIKEVYEFLNQADETVSRMTKQGFERLASKQILDHTMKHM